MLLAHQTAVIFQGCQLDHLEGATYMSAGMLEQGNISYLSAAPLLVEENICWAGTPGARLIFPGFQLDHLEWPHIYVSWHARGAVNISYLSAQRLERATYMSSGMLEVR